MSELSFNVVFLLAEFSAVYHNASCFPDRVVFSQVLSVKSFISKSDADWSHVFVHVTAFSAVMFECISVEYVHATCLPFSCVCIAEVTHFT